jgi:hypothetical protein
LEEEMAVDKPAVKIKVKNPDQGYQAVRMRDKDLMVITQNFDVERNQKATRIRIGELTLCWQDGTLYIELKVDDNLIKRLTNDVLDGRVVV